LRTSAWSLSLSLLLLTTAACGSDGGTSTGIVDADTAADSSNDASASGDTGSDTETDASPDTGAGSGDTGSDTGADAGSGDTGGDTAPVSACADPVAQCGPAAIASCIETDSGGFRCACDAEAERALLLEGVTAFDTSGALPSYLVVGGRNAFPVIVDSGERIIAAAAFQGAGRVFTIAHEGLLNRDEAASPGLAQLVRNAVAWAGAGSRHTGVIALDRSYDRAAALLEAEGYTVVVGAADALDGVDVFVTTNYEEYSDANLANIRAFVEAGGGLISGGHAWWWGQSRDDEATNFPGNKLLRPTGILVTGDTADSGPYDLVAHPASDLLQATCALDAMAAVDAGQISLSSAEADRAASAAGVAVSWVPTDSPIFVAAQAFSDAQGPVIPTEANPVVPATEPVRALAARVQIREALDLPADQVVAHPAGSDFPGPVAQDAPRLSKTLTIDGNDAGYPLNFVYSGAGDDLWRSTGLYAAPGERITITIPSNLAGDGLGVQLGAHTDTLFGLDSWPRMPRIVRSARLAEAVTVIANGFGGPIYITVPRTSSLGPVTVTIEGAVGMAHHVRGRDTLADWQAMQQLGAPWAEIETDGWIGTIPASVALEVADPAAPQDFWARAMTGAGTLSGFDRSTLRSERIVADREISAGYLHSGYPVMGHLDAAPQVALVSGSAADGMWGPFHEFGHNHQWNDWILPGTTETTCNLWSVYLSEEVAGIPRALAHPAITAASRASTVAAWRRAPDFANWSVWTALETYLQLQERFGWELFTTVFTRYRNMSAAERPADDDNARIQTWVIESSRASGYNLINFYEAWAFPIDAATRTAVAGLPEWLDHPMR
jgi:hypothetical protein